MESAGFFVIFFRIHSLIVTLGIGTFLHGITLWIGDSMTISGISSTLVNWVIVKRLLGIPLEGDEHWAETTFPGGTRFALHAAHEGVGTLSSGTVQVDFAVDDADAAAVLLRERGVI